MNMEEKVVRAAIYARFSAFDHNTPLEQQINDCYTYCSDKTYLVEKHYVCSDVDTEDPMRAPLLALLRQAAAEGQIDVLVVASANCIKYLPAWQAIYIGEFEECNVRIESALERHGTHLVVQQIITDTDMAVAQILHMRESATKDQRRRKKRGDNK